MSEVTRLHFARYPLEGLQVYSMLGSRRGGLDVDLPGRCRRHQIHHFQGHVRDTRLGSCSYPRHRNFHGVAFNHPHGLHRGDQRDVGRGSSFGDDLLPKGKVLGG